MKRTLIALGVAAAVALPVVADAAPTLYGKLNLTVDQIKDDAAGKDLWQVDSNASRFGVKGDETLTPSLSAIYQIEWEVNGAGSTAPYNASTDLSQRNRFVGLKSNDLGALKLGRYDSYLKTIGQNVDLFADQIADNSNVLAGKDRLSNVIGYESPSWAGVNLNVLVQPGETKAPKPATPGVKYDNGLADAISSTLAYTNNDIGLTLALGYNKNVMSKFAALNGYGAFATPLVASNAVAGTPGSINNYSPADTVGTARTDILRAVASYNIKPIGLTLNAMYQQAARAEAYKYGTTTALANANPNAVKPEETGWLVSAAWVFAEGWTGKLQYVASSTDFKDATIEKVDMNEATLGLDYNFTKSTKVFGLYSMLDTKNKNNPTTASNGLDQDVKRNFLSLGIEQKF